MIFCIDYFKDIRMLRKSLKINKTLKELNLKNNIQLDHVRKINIKMYFSNWYGKKYNEYVKNECRSKRKS
jgi:hypothetical protein